MIKRIHIENYKSFGNLDLELRPLTIIFGPNASGKSNFLDALYLLSRLVTKKNIKEAFEGHRGLPLESFYYGDKGYEALRQSDRISFTFEVDVELSPATIKKIEETVQAKRRGLEAPSSSKKIITEKFLRYRLVIEALPETGYLRITDEKLCAIKQNGNEKRRSAFVERVDKRLHLRMEGQAHPLFHEVGLDHTIVSTSLYEPHYPHISAFRAELANWHSYYLEPKTLMREEVPLAEVESIDSRGENLAAFINTLKNKHEKDYESFNLSLRRILPTNARIEIEPLKEGLIGLRLSENGNWFSARLISEGTLRLIGLLAAIHPKSPATLVAFEEPENGVHPARLKLISDVLKNAVEQYGKQIIITTHSPILPEYFVNEDLFVCGREGKQTIIRPFSSYGPLFRKGDIERALEDRILRGDFGG
ncbi:MAG: AAA family ATPase [candidate division KSB1 bacterium]|nr:AAA family ATPase [candidate division KSB1 bacterium]MDZ7304953.1 AAA family ATPase [candidate division KSB1 bacterium]MDZ7314014.1 AAA family ATPase [candidate division KSB1 bacterium]